MNPCPGIIVPSPFQNWMPFPFLIAPSSLAISSLVVGFSCWKNAAMMVHSLISPLASSSLAGDWRYGRWLRAGRKSVGRGAAMFCRRSRARPKAVTPKKQVVKIHVPQKNAPKNEGGEAARDHGASTAGHRPEHGDRFRSSRRDHPSDERSECHRTGVNLQSTLKLPCFFSKN
jgi:hypothetical protein